MARTSTLESLDAAGEPATRGRATRGSTAASRDAGTRPAGTTTSRFTLLAPEAPRGTRSSPSAEQAEAMLDGPLGQPGEAHHLARGEHLISAEQRQYHLVYGSSKISLGAGDWTPVAVRCPGITVGC